MFNHPFENLLEALLRTGVAPRHARRTILELDCHFRQLVQDALERGDTEGAPASRLGSCWAPMRY
jgi:hypothetical protein